MPANAEFPDGFILAGFPFPTVLTRNLCQIEDYANVYGIITYYIGSKW